LLKNPEENKFFFHEKTKTGLKNLKKIFENFVLGQNCWAPLPIDYKVLRLW